MCGESRVLNAILVPLTKVTDNSYIENYFVSVCRHLDSELLRPSSTILTTQLRLAAEIEACITDEIDQPSPAIDLLVRLDLAPERVAYVGDRLDTDARGARDAGLRGVWLARGAADTDRSKADDVVTISTLHELAELL